MAPGRRRAKDGLEWLRYSHMRSFSSEFNDPQRLGIKVYGAWCPGTACWNPSLSSLLTGDFRDQFPWARLIPACVCMVKSPTLKCATPCKTTRLLITPVCVGGLRQLCSNSGQPNFCGQSGFRGPAEIVGASAWQPP